MIGFTLRQTQAGFFDRQKVIKAADRATRRVLSKFGAFVRTRAKSSIRKRKASSAPGAPPSSHTGDLKKFIYFAYDATGGQPNVVIGPTLFSQRPRGHKAVGATVPEVLEKGGTIEIAGRRGKPSRLAQIQARPYMLPAFEHEKQSTLPRLWLNSVK